MARIHDTSNDDAAPAATMKKMEGFGGGGESAGPAAEFRNGSAPVRNNYDMTGAPRHATPRQLLLTPRERPVHECIRSRRWLANRLVLPQASLGAALLVEQLLIL